MPLPTAQDVRSHIAEMIDGYIYNKNSGYKIPVRDARIKQLFTRRGHTSLNDIPDADVLEFRREVDDVINGENK